ncbi:MAG: HD domain-containing protein [Bdellovibrionales bacterium]|nr:HD domain-containing protein [Oligoflexia bacterium]
MDAHTLNIVPVLSTPVSALDLERSLTLLIAAKDQGTFEHSNRVAEITAEWIQYMKSRHQWVDFDEQDLVLAARLHDVGKIAVLDQILNKAGPLTLEEREQLNLHSEIGYELVRDLKSAEKFALAIRHHHERWDGGGYPLGLKREQIPFFAQVICIVDAFDAMTSDRCYQKARSTLEAIVELEQNAGRQFSPLLTESFVQFLHSRNT